MNFTAPGVAETLNALRVITVKDATTDTTKVKTEGLGLGRSSSTSATASGRSGSSTCC